MALATSVLESGHDLRFQAHGSSMRPLVRDGDLVLVRMIDPGRIKIGDILLYSNQLGLPVVHRVLRRQKGSNGVKFLIKGDRTGVPDGWIHQERVFGRIEALERNRNLLDLKKFAAKFLGKLAVIQSSLQIKHSILVGVPLIFLKRLRVFSCYLD